MLRVVFAGLALALAAGAPARAAETLANGPLPDWVKPLEVTPPPLGEGGRAVRMLLQDRQLRFGPEGDSEFVEQVIQVRTVQGLTTLGSVTLAWNPETDTVTVNRLRILRAGVAPIDLLAKQTFTIIRRETNLERAIVDGALTAAIQPEGLQVGDAVDLAYTVVHKDPVFKGRADRITVIPPVAKTDRLHLRASWDESRPLKWRAGEGLPQPKVTKAGGRVDLDIDLKDPPELKLTSGAPQRYFPFRDFSVSEFQSWAEVSALTAPLYVQGAQLAPDSPLRAETTKIRAASSDPKVRAAAALALVQDKVRYLAVVMNLGGYVPAEADKTWERRYGDCKAKTVLLLALLRELDIEAEAALVSANRGDGLNERLPAMTAFDHVIVRATIGGKVYWLDGTRTGDRSLDTLRPPPFQWALPIRERDASLVAIEQPPLTEPDSYVRLKIDASAGLDAPAPTHGEMTLSAARSALLDYGSQTPAERDKALKRWWSAYPWIDIKTIASTKDPATGVTRLIVDGTAKVPFLRAPGGRTFRIFAAELGGRKIDTREADEPHAVDAPYLVDGYPGYSVFNLAITLPRGGEGFTFEAPDADTKVAGRRYTRHARLEKGVFTVETTQRTLVREVPAAEAAKAGEALEQLGKVRVALKAPDGYRQTDQDLAALKTETPTTAEGFIQRGDRFMQGGKFDLAMADFDKAVETDPKSSFAYANRALGNFYLNRLDAAKADIAKSQDLDSRNFVALHAVGVIAMKEGRPADAAAAFQRASDLRADNTFALRALAGAYLVMDQPEKALAALADLERILPGQPELAMLRHQVFLRSGQPDRALATLDDALAKAPANAGLHVLRGTALSRAGRYAEADKAFVRALELQPTDETWIARANGRDPADISGRLADLAAAEKLEPRLAATAVQVAAVLGEARRYDEALAGLERALKIHVGNADLIYARADIYARAGKTGLAAKDFAELRQGAGASAERLNAICWGQAIRNVALETALADCDAALKAQPDNANALDSRAFVLLRLGRLPEAVSAYDAAIKVRPRQAESLYGRALAKLRLDKTAEGQADLAAARAADAGIDTTFTGYGLAAPKPTAVAAAASSPAP